MSDETGGSTRAPVMDRPAGTEVVEISRPVRTPAEREADKKAAKSRGKAEKDQEKANKADEKLRNETLGTITITFEGAFAKGMSKEDAKKVFELKGYSASREIYAALRHYVDDLETGAEKRNEERVNAIRRAERDENDKKLRDEMIKADKRK